jgi:hypothetical protein
MTACQGLVKSQHCRTPRQRAADATGPNQPRRSSARQGQLRHIHIRVRICCGADVTMCLTRQMHGCATRTSIYLAQKLIQVESVRIEVVQNERSHAHVSCTCNACAHTLLLQNSTSNDSKVITLLYIRSGLHAVRLQCCCRVVCRGARPAGWRRSRQVTLDVAFDPPVP